MIANACITSSMINRNVTTKIVSKGSEKWVVRPVISLLTMQEMGPASQILETKANRNLL